MAVLLVVAVVAAFGTGAYWWYFGGGRTDDAVATPTPTSTESCPTPVVELPDPLPGRRDVTVEILNGTDRAGLATQTADAMALLGFQVATFGNADRPVDGVAVVAYGKGDLAEAVVVASYLPGATLTAVRRNTGGVVTATLGPEFREVASPAEAKQAVGAVVLPTPSPICS